MSSVFLDGQQEFNRRLTEGKLGESRIAAWLKSGGFSVLPVYEIEQQTGKGPRLFMPKKQIIAPDMFVFQTTEAGLEAYWIEANHKEAFTWYRQKGQFETGIDLRHYHDYCLIDATTPWPVWLLFLHRGGQAKDSPPSPSGLYGNLLSYLRLHESHQSDRWADGMVYWAITDLQKLADLETALSLE